MEEIICLFWWFVCFDKLISFIYDYKFRIKLQIELDYEENLEDLELFVDVKVEF